MCATMALQHVQWGVVLTDLIHLNTGDPFLIIQHTCQASLGSEGESTTTDNKNGLNLILARRVE